MVEKLLNGVIRLETMSSQEFTELMNEWKEDIKEITREHADEIIRITLHQHLKSATNENEIYIMKNYLGSVENE